LNSDSCQESEGRVPYRHTVPKATVTPTGVNCATRNNEELSVKNWCQEPAGRN